jgi:hypothetical protein
MVSLVCGKKKNISLPVFPFRMDGCMPWRGALAPVCYGPFQWHVLGTIELDRACRHGISSLCRNAT